MASRTPTKMRVDQLMQGKEQSCEPQPESCPQHPWHHTGPGSHTTWRQRPPLPRGDYSLKARLIERRLLLVHNQSHLLLQSPMLACLSSNYLFIYFLRQSLELCPLTSYYLCQQLKEASAIFLHTGSEIHCSVHQFRALGLFIKLTLINSLNKITPDIVGVTKGAPLFWDWWVRLVFACDLSSQDIPVSGVKIKRKISSWGPWGH